MQNQLVYLNRKGGSDGLFHSLPMHMLTAEKEGTGKGERTISRWKELFITRLLELAFTEESEKDITPFHLEIVQKQRQSNLLGFESKINVKGLM